MQIPTGKSMSLSTLYPNSNPPSGGHDQTKEVNMVTITEGVTYTPYRPTAPAANWVPSYSPLYEAESILFDRNLDRENRMNIVQSIAINLKEEIGAIIRAGAFFGPHGYETPIRTQASKRQGKQIKKIRRELNRWFRADIKELEREALMANAFQPLTPSNVGAFSGLDTEGEVVTDLCKEDYDTIDAFTQWLRERMDTRQNREFTQERQAKAQAKVVSEAKARKEERRAKHFRRTLRRLNKKVNGVTPKQVKRVKKVVEVPSQVTAVAVVTQTAAFVVDSEGVVEVRPTLYSIMAVPTLTIDKEEEPEESEFYVQLSKKEKQDIAMGLEWARHQRINRRKTQKEVFAMDFMVYKRDNDIKIQGRRMRKLVSSLMNNKEVQS